MEEKDRERLSIDNAADAATYVISVMPGPLYYLARIDASALPEAAQSKLAHDSRLAPGTVADAHLFGDIREDCQKANLHAPSLDRRLDRAAHTVTLVLQSGAAPRVPQQPTAQ